MQGRGLKLVVELFLIVNGVAPHAGAWIETSLVCVSSNLAWSPLMQGRGLKPNEFTLIAIPFVAPHAGAWIETMFTY